MGYGGFAKRALQPHSLVGEYVGELINNKLRDQRVLEGKGAYMVQIAGGRVIDLLALPPAASGGLVHHLLKCVFLSYFFLF